jgi:hypothetical protein
MQDFLVQHALTNVWCSPEQDNPHIFAAKRISKPVGELNQFLLMSRTIKLPVQGKRYHVYNIGQLPPGFLNLVQTDPSWARETWRLFSDSIITNKVLIQVYAVTGLMLPRFNSYFMFTNDKDLIFIIEDEPKFGVNFATEQLYFRFYSNAFFQSDRGDATDDILFITGMKIQNNQQTIALQQLLATYTAKHGKVYCYINGFRVQSLSLVNVAIGDIVEFYYDSSVKRVVTFNVKDLLSFSSILDDKYKFLLHYAGAGDNTIDYQDDVDIHIYYPLENNRFRGRYFHRNAVDSHRMVTHRDYSVPTQYVTYMIQRLITDLGTTGIDPTKFVMELSVRESGLLRPLIFDDSRIFELYKLPNDRILQAMMGVNSTLDIWKAENLENSAYVKLTKAEYSEVTLEAVQDAYGYNSISKIVGDTPAITTLSSGRQQATLPVALQENSTVYEYNANGHLLGVHFNSNNQIYNAVDNQTRLIEAISGRGSKRPDVRFGTDNIPLPSYDNYRVYMTFQSNGIPTTPWQDITGTDKYHVENGFLIWNNTEIDQLLMVRTDATFLDYEVTISSVNGNLFITLTEEEDRGSGYQEYALPVPLGELDVWMNDKSLINGLDYIVKFPQIYFLTKKHMVQPALTAPQRIRVRWTGFANSDLTFDKPDDYGFIQYGILSHNNRYDIRDDKVLRITVNGSCKDRSALKFSEKNDSITVADPINGQPYQIKDVIVPLKQLVNENTYTMKAHSLAIDEALSDYMTIRLPEPEQGVPSVIPQLYHLVSTFFSRIIDALRDNEITYEEIANAGSDSAVMALCQPYEYTLAFDPINEDNNIDALYTLVVPHPNSTVVTIQLYQYRFLMKVQKLYGQGRIDISQYVNFNT